jgi:DNA invertase Pin-like site-specific DNA recombinase
MAKGQRVGYIRVSSVDQNTARQLEGLDLDKSFEDKASAKDTNRPKLKACLAHLREGDTLIVHSMDRLARNLMDLRTIVDDLTARGVAVQFVKESLTFTRDASSMSKLLLNVMGAFAEFERELIRERQREGIAIARKAGKFAKDRAKKLTPEQVEEIRALVAAGTKKARIAEAYGISRETLYQYLARFPVSEGAGTVN